MLSTVLSFREGRVIVPFLWRRPQVFPRVGVLMNLKRFDVLLDNKLTVIRWYLFCFLLLFIEDERWPIGVVVLLDPSIFTENWIEDENVKFYMKRKGQYNTIAFFVNLAQLFIFSYLTTPWRMFPSKKIRALICFSSTIDENADTVHLTEGFVL